MTHLLHRLDDLVVGEDLGLEHLVLLEELHLGLQVAQVLLGVLLHLKHALRHPLLRLQGRDWSSRNKQTVHLSYCYMDCL